jgi:hypothetical protein
MLREHGGRFRESIGAGETFTLRLNEVTSIWADPRPTAPDAIALRENRARPASFDADPDAAGMLAEELAATAFGDPPAGTMHLREPAGLFDAPDSTAGSGPLAKKLAAELTWD